MIKTAFGTTNQKPAQLQLAAACVLAALEQIPVEKDYTVLCTVNGTDLPFDHALIQLTEGKTSDSDNYAVSAKHFILAWHSSLGEIMVGFSKGLDYIPTEKDIFIHTQDAVLAAAPAMWNFLLTGENSTNAASTA